jgi:hypothetical protein
VSGLPGPKKIKYVKFGHEQFKKGQIIKGEKGKIKTMLYVLLKLAQKKTTFITIEKGKKGQMDKSFISRKLFQKGQRCNPARCVLHMMG